ncbi:hypothetical protein KSS87_012983 [Heliosperma pusillum]|nr:hypothetical protein KSS87_012983 [Heliosperma pusillum]
MLNSRSPLSDITNGSRLSSRVNGRSVRDQNSMTLLSSNGTNVNTSPRPSSSYCTPNQSRGKAARAKRKMSCTKKRSNDASNVVPQSTTDWEGYWDIGDPDYECEKCHAQMWYQERIGKDRGTRRPQFSLCCSNGKVVLPYFAKPPEFLNPNNPERLNDELTRLLKDMVDENNVLAQTFRMARDRLCADIDCDVSIRLISRRDTDGRTYNRPTASEVAGLIEEDIGPNMEKRDIIVQKENGRLQRISKLHPLYTPLQYPLLFPFGEDGYRLDIPHSESSLGASSNDKPRDELTCREWIAFRIQERSPSIEYPTIVSSGKGFHQFLVDGYMMVESHRLNFLRFHQDRLRVDNYNNLSNAVERGEVEPSSAGSHFIVPSSFQGGEAFMKENYLDAMTISIYTVEFQKRGLPHAHILLFLHRDDKFPAVADVDKIMSAEIPDPIEDLVLHAVVCAHMLHGPRRIAKRDSDACYALGLIGDDKEYIDVIEEASDWGSGSYLRHLFSTLLLSGTLSMPSRVWDKTWRLLSDDILHRQRRILNNQVASSGIAATLIPGGRTAHSRFGIPLSVTENSTCPRMKPGSDLTELLRMAKLIIWDEAPMTHKHSFEALDRSLKDVMRVVDERNANEPFGGKVVVFGGDFRQILPVVPKGSRADIVHASLCSSYLWSSCKVLKLTKNMRLQVGSSSNNGNDIKKLSEWILEIGDGLAGGDNTGEVELQFSLDLLIEDVSDPIASLVNVTYPSLQSQLWNPDYLQERAILAPTHEIVDEVNDYVLSLIDKDERIYLSSDEVSKDDTSIGERDLHSTEFLNSIKCSGLPNHQLRLKIGAMIRLYLGNSGRFLIGLNLNLWDLHFITYMENLAQLEALCGRLYESQDYAERAYVENTLGCFSRDSNNIPQLQYILENARNPYAFSYCADASALILLFSKLICVSAEGNLAINYLAARGAELEHFVTSSVIQLLSRVTKFSWFDDDSFREIVKDTMTFFNQEAKHYAVGLKALNQLVIEMNQRTAELSVVDHRKVTIKFRDEALLQIFEISLTSLHGLKTDAQPKLQELALSLSLQCLSFDFAGMPVDETSDDVGSIQLPANWKPVIEEPSTVNIYFEYYAATIPPLTKLVEKGKEFNFAEYWTRLFLNPAFLV